jgi:photosystem II stability/assembly factor-like uncharacterized protein
MTRFQKVVQILDDAVSGPSAPVGFHGAFWRGVSRDVFVAKKVFGLPLVTIGDGAGSTLVKALKGETPFGADLGNPEADFNRMPSGLAPVPAADITFIKTWIDEGCPEDEADEIAPLAWRPTNAPVASSRTDDVWFVDPLTGWAVNSDGSIIKTTDGGESWTVQHSAPAVYLRCVGFANANAGWVGTLSPARRLLQTSDGGTSWRRVAPLPASAPVAVCGLSVVSDKIIYCSGTNRPTDQARMMKTADAGATWTAWEMSAHASVLIDCLFVDALHGWVVGGKADEPTPTTRDKLKPVVLETTDGGSTWINRLAGQEAEFPFGEWGWKIQFLDEKVGFVSLENFSAAAILKTTDGGQTWTRLKVTDPQRNMNLEGVGFVDGQRGWVGGWGPGGFGGGGSPQGSSSATTDGGLTWADANDIGRFINRFRFFGKPVFVGYAAGDTVYKYSADPLPPSAAAAAAADAARQILPEPHLTGGPRGAAIPMHVPPGTKRLTVRIWNRFGEDLGDVLDEIHPAHGPRVFEWPGTDGRGEAVAAGDYIVRAIADDVTASSRLTLAAPAGARGLSGRTTARRVPVPAPRPSRFATLAELVAAPTHDLAWLHDALQTAIQLELSTLPPYLTARWTIKNLLDPVAGAIKEVRGEEMLHMGLACNLLTAIGGMPLIADEAVVPKYPGPLPWGIRPGLIVSLRKLDKAQAAVFMEIEYPQGGPLAIAAANPPVTIGEFYASVLSAFKDIEPPLSLDRQLEGPLGLTTIGTPEEVEQAIMLINLQGEGSKASPEEAPGKLAHYYQFGEIFHGKRLVPDGAGGWEFSGADLPMPDVHDMADIPTGGYQKADVPDIAVWERIERFDRLYSEMLRLLQAAWTNGDVATLWESIGTMGQMGATGRVLVTDPRPNGQGNYGPCFRYAPAP